MDRPRLLAVDGIRCEATLAGHLLYLDQSQTCPVSWATSAPVTGKNNVNIATLSLGRQEKPDRPGDPAYGHHPNRNRSAKCPTR